MISFTNEERLLIENIKNLMSPFFPVGFDTSVKENLLAMIDTWKAKGMCQPLRADQGFQRGLFTSIHDKLGAPLPTQKEIIEKQKQAEIDGMLKRTKEVFDEKLSKIQKQFYKTKEEKEKAIAKYTGDIMLELKKLEDKKKELEERIKISETATQRLEANKKAKEKSEAEIEEEENKKSGEKMRKCWNCGQWFPVRGGIATKHTKDCIIAHPPSERLDL